MYSHFVDVDLKMNNTSMNKQPLIAKGFSINTLRPGQNGRHFADAIFKCIFLNENVWTPIKISLKFVPKGPINNIPALVQIMAWRQLGDKPLSQPVMVRLPTHICVTRSQWVKGDSKIISQAMQSRKIKPSLWSGLNPIEPNHCSHDKAWNNAL